MVLCCCLLAAAAVHPLRCRGAGGELARWEEGFSNVDPRVRVLGVDLLDELEGTPPSKPVRVLVELSDDVGAGDGDGMEADRRRAHAAVVDELITQYSLGEAEAYLWMVNAFCVRSTPSALLRLAGDERVRRISMVPRWRLLPPPRAEAMSAADGGGDDATAATSALLKAIEMDPELREDAGRGVVVGHIDTGVDAEHPWLKGRIAGWKDFVGDARAPFDPHGHGTHTAGLIAGSACGVAPRARLLVARALGADGSADLVRLLRALQWMLDPDGDPATEDAPRIINNSWGVPLRVLRRSSEGGRYFWRAVEALRRHGAVVVCAVGNDGLFRMSVPASYSICMAVGAVDSGLRHAFFSGGGTVSWGRTLYMKPDLVAPGVELISSWPGGMKGPLSGTSQACAVVSGVAAFILSRSGGRLDRPGLERLILDSCRDLGDPGRDTSYGEGIISVRKALELLRAGGGPDEERRR